MLYVYVFYSVTYLPKHVHDESKHVAEMHNKHRYYSLTVYEYMHFNGRLSEYNMQVI
jgi:hypothetical protein